MCNFVFDVAGASIDLLSFYMLRKFNLICPMAAFATIQRRTFSLPNNQILRK